MLFDIEVVAAAEDVKTGGKELLKKYPLSGL
jgi:hypothetical protein